VQTSTRYDRDTIRGIGHDAEQSLGLGVHLLEGNGLKLSVGAGALARHRETFDGEAGWAGLFDGFQNLSYRISERVTLKQALALSASPNFGADYQIKLETALVSKLTEAIRMSLRYELEYDRSVLPELRDTRRLVTSLGYVF
jgi:putative salt-induced outer membrane protein YdiY